MRKSEVKASKDGRHMLYCKNIVSSNKLNKLNERYEISGTTVFLLYWLQVDSQPFNIVMKFYLLLPALLLVVM